MTQQFISDVPSERASAIQRTLIVALGPLAVAVHERLRPSFDEPSVLSHAIALLAGDAPGNDLATALHDKLARISRAGGRAELAAAGYRLDRRQELALLLIVDLTGGGDTRPTRLSAEAAALAHAGWGMDTQATIIALADDWTAAPAREGLRALADAAWAEGAVVIPLNRVNEEGFQLDDAEAFLALAAAVVEALVVTPLRDALYGFGEPGPGWGGPSLTTVGLARWLWTPEPIADYLAAAWRSRVIAQWLAPAEPEGIAAVTHRAGGWFDAQGLLPQALTTLLEPSVAPYDVPAWPVPYPWAAAEAVDRWRRLAEALGGAAGHAAVVPVLLDEWSEWAAAREATLRATLSAQLDGEPAAGFALARAFLKALAGATFDAGGLVSHRQDQLEEQSRELRAALGELLAASDAILRRWPSGSPAAWLALALRPWRWPGLVWEYWRLHGLAQKLVALVTRLATIEREQVVAAAVAALYEQYEAVIERTTLHLEEAADMLSSARAPAAPPPLEPRLLAWLDAPESPERQAGEAAAALGGLGRLAEALDEGFVAALHDLSRRRFRALLDMPAVAALEQMLGTPEMVDAWWAERRAEATPLWLYDDAGQPEENRGSGREQTAVAAMGVERLQGLCGAAGRPDWRWLPTDERRVVSIMRWRSGVQP